MVPFVKAATILDKSNSERRVLFSVQFEGAVHRGREVAAGAEGSRSRHFCLQEADRGCWHSACFLLFIHSASPLHGMVLPTL